MKRLWIETNAHVAAIERFILEALDSTPAAGLTVKHIHILDALYLKDKQHASEVAKMIGFKATSFTPTLDELEIRGYIVRSQDPHDRRAVFISLTDKAKALEETVCDVLGQTQRAF